MSICAKRETLMIPIFCLREILLNLSHIVNFWLDSADKLKSVIAPSSFWAIYVTQLLICKCS